MDDDFMIWVNYPFETSVF